MNDQNNQQSSRRIVVTGTGWVTPLGNDVDTAWANLLAGKNGFGPVTHFPAGTFRTNFGAQVKDFDLANDLDNPQRHAGAHRHTQYALAAAAQAWKQAGLADAGIDPTRVGVYLGAGEGLFDFDNYAAASVAHYNADTRSVDTAAWAKEAYQKMTVQGELEQEPHMPAAHVADEFEAFGPTGNCMTACAASTQSVGEAFELLKRGDADVMITGGAHSMLHILGMTGFIRLTAMSTNTASPESASRPFDASRDGFVMGEGAGMVVLETLEHALARGATPLCELAGYGSSADAYRITDIDPEGTGAARAMGAAIRQAGIDPSKPGEDGRPQVHYISAHGTSTPENDGIETKAVKHVFGELAPSVPFSSVKSMVGHLIQAAGAVELITCIQAIRTGWIPPTMNLETPGEGCDLDYVQGKARDLNPVGGVDVAMSNGFGFGGQNDTVVVRKYTA